LDDRPAREIEDLRERAERAERERDLAFLGVRSMKTLSSSCNEQRE